MRRIAGVLVLCGAAVALANRTSEVRVGATGTQMPVLSARTQAEIQNNGPDSICCAFGSTISNDTCRIIAGRVDGGPHGGTWSLNARDSTAIRCKVLGGSQVDGGTTIFTEVQ